MGVAAGSLAGGPAQAFFSHRVILGAFAGLTFLGGVIMLRPLTGDGRETGECSRPWAVAGSFLGGFVAAVASVGGASLLSPFMILVLRAPTRTAIGSSLALVMLAGAFGLLGRAASAAVLWLWLWPLLLGAGPGALAGSYLSRRLPTAVLRRVFAVIVLGVAVKTGLSL